MGGTLDHQFPFQCLSLGLVWYGGTEGKAVPVVLVGTTSPLTITAPLGMLS
jgi:hypothetical protein